MKFINKIKAIYRSRYYTSTRLRERYVLSDVKFLQAAYRNGPSYIQGIALQYLENFETQQNLDFLMSEFKNCTVPRLKFYLFQAILVVGDDINLIISTADEQMIESYIDYYKNQTTPDFNLKEPDRQSTEELMPVTFRDKLKVDLRDLERRLRDSGI